MRKPVSAIATCFRDKGNDMPDKRVSYCALLGFPFRHEDLMRDIDNND